MQALDLSDHKPIRDLVYEALKEAILKGDFEAGDRLLESETAAEMKVSRTPVREALRMLETEGLVDYVPRKGIFIRKFSRQDIIEIYSIRSALEALAATFSISNITADELALLRQSLAEMRGLTQDGPISALCESAKRFNDILIDSCKTPRLINLISTYRGYLARFRAVTLGGRERKFIALREHEAIVEAIEKKDADRVQQIVREHLEGALSEHLKYIDRGN